MKALIFAAGLGMRLRPLTDNLPKALVPIGPSSYGDPDCRRPLLWWVARRLVAAGADELIINVHHFADKVIDYVHSMNDFGVKVEFSDERDCLLDTGGGLLKARPLLEGSGEPFPVHNVDIVSNIDIADFCHSIHGDAVASLAVADRPSERKLLFDCDMRLVGWKNTLTGELRGPAAGCSRMKFRELAFTGIHCLSPKIFRAFDLYPEFSGTFGIMDFYLKICSEFHIFGDERTGLNYLDVGTLDAYEKIAFSGLLDHFSGASGA